MIDQISNFSKNYLQTLMLYGDSLDTQLMSHFFLNSITYHKQSN